MTTAQQLAQKLRRFEQANRATHRPASQPASRVTKHGGELFSTGIPALDELLPEPGVSPGTLIEWLSDGEGSGCGTLAFTVAGHLLQTRSPQTCVVIDSERTFSPSAMLRWVDDPRQLIVVHPANDHDALWTLEQSLRCPGVAVVVSRIGRLHSHTYRRLQLAAETGGAIGLLLRPGEYQSQPSWADIRLRIEPLPFVRRGRADSSQWEDGRRIRVELTHCRGRGGGGVAELEIDDETGDVRSAARLAAATPALCATGT